MGHVQSRSGELLGKLNVALDHGRFRGRLHTAQAETKRSWAFVHRAVFGHARVFRVLDDGEVETGRRPQRVAHHGVAEDGTAVVADCDPAGALQGSEISKHGALAGMGRGDNREHVDHSAAFRLLNPGNPFGRIDNRRRVRHAANGSEAASSSSGSSGCDALFVALARLTQVDVQINEAGGDDQAASVEGFVCGAADFVGGCELRDAAVAQEQVHGCVQLCGRVDNATAFDQEGARFGFIVCHSFVQCPSAAKPQT